MSSYSDAITAAIPPILTGYADPNTIDVIEWCLRINRSGLDSLTTQDFAREVPPILNSLISTPAETRMIFGACQLPEPRWLIEALQPPTRAELVHRYRAAAAARRTLTGTREATTNAAISHGVIIVMTNRALLTAGQRDLVLTLNAESDIHDQIARGAAGETLARLHTRQQAAAEQVARLTNDPDAPGTGRPSKGRHRHQLQNGSTARPGPAPGPDPPLGPQPGKRQGLAVRRGPATTALRQWWSGRRKTIACRRYRPLRG